MPRAASRTRPRCARRWRRPAAATTAAEVLAAFEDDFAVIGRRPARADDARGGLEEPHAVRGFRPRPARARGGGRDARARDRALRALARETTADGGAEQPRFSPGVRAALRETAASLKLRQMAPLYATRESTAYGDRAPMCCARRRLVTRPARACAAGSRFRRTRASRRPRAAAR